jgi:hypothetical protein
MRPDRATTGCSLASRVVSTSSTRWPNSAGRAKRSCGSMSMVSICRQSRAPARSSGAGNVPTSRHHGAPKHGDALLAGLVRCGRKLTVRYTGTKHDIPRYACHRGLLNNGEPRCIAFGGLRVDDAIAAALLQIVEPAAIAAAVAAEAEAGDRRDQVREALIRDLEAARYAADRAFRQYDAADPANRLVAGELETR